MNQPKRLLIISKFFFPQPSVGGVRVTQWSRFFWEFGWQPTILCQYHGHAATSELLRKHVHDSVRVEYFNAPGEDGRAPAAEPKRVLLSLMARSPTGHMVVPDLAKSVWRHARGKALAVALSVKPQVILTSSPPHSIHDLGRWLSAKLNIPWVADFRDPYLIDSRYRPAGLGKLRYKAYARFGRNIYDEASLIVHAIPVHARWARLAYPSARDRIITITNGCPPELADISTNASQTTGKRSVSVVGALLNEPTILLAQAIKLVVNQGEDLELRLVGEPPLATKSIKAILGDRLVTTGSVAHNIALKEIAEADVLVCNLDENRAKFILLSSKLFEYIAAGKPTIVVNPSRQDRHLLRGLSGVKSLVNPDVAELAKAICWALSSEAIPTKEQLEQFRSLYDRRAQTRRVAELLDGLIAKN
jgi:glycosyltransferase involved in cell wall biosynthesis